MLHCGPADAAQDQQIEQAAQIAHPGLPLDGQHHFQGWNLGDIDLLTVTLQHCRFRQFQQLRVTAEVAAHKHRRPQPGEVIGFDSLKEG